MILRDIYIRVGNYVKQKSTKDTKENTFSINTYFLWNARTGSASRSEMSSPLPLAITSGCFLHKSQPTCEKKNPRVALCGSASVSEYLWCTRWSLAQCNAQSWNAIVLNTAKITLSGNLAL